MKYRSPLRATETYIVTVSVQVFKRARVILKQRVIFLHDDGPEKDQVWLLQMFLKLYMAISLPDKVDKPCTVQVTLTQLFRSRGIYNASSGKASE